ncbi:MAG TPA: hypothetical protein VIT41_12675 [Microlunatus sp.]
MRVPEIPPEVAMARHELRAAIEAAVPPKVLDRNLLIATWRWPILSRVSEDWIAPQPQPGLRDRRAVILLAEVVRHFDVVALQGIMGSAPTLQAVLRVLGPEWAYMMTGLSRETTYRERTAVVFDTRRVLPQGLAGQVVVPEGGKRRSENDDFLSSQFFRPPFFAGFRCLGASFTVVNQHIVFGTEPERVAEMRALCAWVAEITSGDYWERNLIILGQLQLFRSGSSVHRVFDAAGLRLPPELVDAPSFVNSAGNLATMASSIAWVQPQGRGPELTIPYARSGVFNYHDRALLPNEISTDLDYLSKHLPVWAEFTVAPGREY